MFKRETERKNGQTTEKTSDIRHHCPSCRSSLHVYNLSLHVYNLWTGRMDEIQRPESLVLEGCEAPNGNSGSQCNSARTLLN